MQILPHFEQQTQKRVESIHNSFLPHFGHYRNVLNPYEKPDAQRTNLVMEFVLNNRTSTFIAESVLRKETSPVRFEIHECQRDRIQGMSLTSSIVSHRWNKLGDEFHIHFEPGYYLFSETDQLCTILKRYQQVFRITQIFQTVAQLLDTES